MDKDVVIDAQGVSKKFCFSLKRSMYYGAHDIFRDTLCLRNKDVKLRKEEFWAVDDVSFKLRRGEAFGIIGPNGSGKTTMLKMLNGIIQPDRGSITVRGRTGALIALGAGFHPQLTGRENVYINGAILGMSKKEIDHKFDAIVDFSGIEEFLDTPVKHYSSGMFVRLGFSVAAHLDPDILLVDEVLAVGDVGFRAKSYEFIKQLQRDGVSIILISHNLPAVYETCSKTMLLWKGVSHFAGDTEAAINLMNRQMFEGVQSGDGPRLVNDPLLGEIEIRGGATIDSINLLNSQGQKVMAFTNNERHTVEHTITFENDAEDPIFGCFVWDNKGRIIHDSYTLRMGIKTGKFRAGKDYKIKWYLTPHLLPDHYNLGLCCNSDGLNHFYYDRKIKAMTLCVNTDSRSDGIVDMDAKLEISGK